MLLPLSSPTVLPRDSASRGSAVRRFESSAGLPKDGTWFDLGFCLDGWWLKQVSTCPRPADCVGALHVVVALVEGRYPERAQFSRSEGVAVAISAVGECSAGHMPSCVNDKLIIKTGEAQFLRSLTAVEAPRSAVLPPAGNGRICMAMHAVCR